MKSLRLPLAPEKADGQQTRGYVESLGSVDLFCPLSCWSDVLCYLFISIYLSSIHLLISLSDLSSTYRPSSSYLSSIYVSIYLSVISVSPIYLPIHTSILPSHLSSHLSIICICLSVIYLYLSMSIPISVYLSIYRPLSMSYLTIYL